MKKTAFLLLLLIFPLSCGTLPVDFSFNDFKKEKPSLYSYLINKKVFILDPSAFGETVTVLTFMEKGKINGDIAPLFNGSIKSLQWKYEKGKVKIYNEREGWFDGTVSVLKNPPEGTAAAYRDGKNIQTLRLSLIAYGKPPATVKEYPSVSGAASMEKVLARKKKFLASMNAAWKSLNKNSAKALSRYIKDLTPRSVKYGLGKEKTAAANKELRSLMDKKLISYLKKKYRGFKKYLHLEFTKPEGTRFYHMFRAPVLSKKTPYKKRFYIQRAGGGKFDVILKKKKDIIFTFKKMKGKLKLVRFHLSWHRNPRGWRKKAAQIITETSSFPSMENINFKRVDAIR